MLVEIVDVGQSEYMVRDMVDKTCSACSSGGYEQSDLIVMNKCDATWYSPPGPGDQSSDTGGTNGKTLTHCVPTI